ncbi:50S ribosomal protein L17 [Candidatus Saccharibacteria bacterium]|nr:50S ribosomal protein L17 [Candidatus Saccharibacteria bacterium]
MHRHGYKGKKFNRETDQRHALIVGLAESLIIRESIETTLPKAKEVQVYTEKLITKAKKGGLHNRRQVIAGLSTLEAAHKLVDDIAPKLSGRTSGHLRVVRTELRRGDAAQMARISFVDDLSKAVKVSKVEKPAAAKKPAAKKPAKTPAKAAK